MGFMARCQKCNHVITAHTRAFLKELMALHNDISHGYNLDYDLDFTITIISEKELNVLQGNAHNRYFWNAFNKARKIA
jgi:hypothetical protein